MMWNWDLNVPGNKEFVAAYKAAYPNEPYPPANEQLGQGYVAAMVLRQALEKAASRDPKKIRDDARIDRVHQSAVPESDGEVRRNGP